MLVWCLCHQIRKHLQYVIFDIILTQKNSSFIPNFHMTLTSTVLSCRHINKHLNILHSLSHTPWPASLTSLTEQKSLSIMSALIWPQGMDGEKWSRVCTWQRSVLQEVLFRCYIPLFVQRLLAQFLLRFRFCLLTAYSWQCCCAISAFILCGQSWVVQTSCDQLCSEMH